ncbi:RluA family pseudouridine synthase [Clostridium boliviensis]|uniref:RNA pseudouridylate synthase n=1 Tax=Clostridium boliviensis TaxID=318465 RepID=A0ABU4GFC5_9CLOT|nr:RluA family pseudouridine synthase [Clostridium boliviensis]MDW2796330.1 RluA family pseudouridine synthase [Clostridium boliviensis]
MNYLITETSNDTTIERYLLEQGYSQSLIRHLRNTENAITAGGLAVYTTHRLIPGEVLTISFPEEKNSENIIPNNLPIDIVFEDDHLLVISKAAGVPIHPSQGNYDNTLANGLAYYFQKKQVPFTYRAINRLDRDTTGLLIIAKNPLSACILSEMVKKHEIHRRYLAVVSGELPMEGTIDFPIARAHDSTIERCVDTVHGDPARTFFKRLCP